MKEKRKYLITGVSGTDPFTEVTSPENTYLDGSLMNILRKGIKTNKIITDIYIYLTKEMDENRTIYTQVINYLYEQYEVETPNIKYYPNDFYKNAKERLRMDDVHKFSSYYKEIYEIYLDILKLEESPTIYINISSGTPAFKADMMLMAVTNNLIVKQVAGKYKDYNSNKITNLKEIKDNYLKEKMDILKNNEDCIASRTTVESITQTKRVLLYESIKDSINKKDYCGIYNNVELNKKYLDSFEEILEIAKNLYYRYIGNNELSKYDEWKKSDKNKLEEFYPIYKFLNQYSGINDNSKELISSIIEKYNMLKIKSTRGEINDWLLITVPLLEAIVEKKVESENIDLNKLNIVGGQAFIDKINELYNEMFGYPYITESKSNRMSINVYFLEDILINILLQEEKNNNYIKVKELKNIITSIEAINIVRDDRVSAAHSIENIETNLLQVKYDKAIKNSNDKIKDSITKTKRIEMINIMKSEYNSFLPSTKQKKAIEFIETKFKCLIELLIINNKEYSKYLIDSLNIYKTLEDKLVNILKSEIYD